MPTPTTAPAQHCNQHKSGESGVLRISLLIPAGGGGLAAPAGLCSYQPWY
jgi:hypothetical protein